MCETKDILINEQRSLIATQRDRIKELEIKVFIREICFWCLFASIVIPVIYRAIF